MGRSRLRRCSGSCGCVPPPPPCTLNVTLCGLPLAGAAVSIVGPSPATTVAVSGTTDASGNIAVALPTAGTYTRTITPPSGNPANPYTDSLASSLVCTPVVLTLPGGYTCCCPFPQAPTYCRSSTIYSLLPDTLYFSCPDGSCTLTYVPYYYVSGVQYGGHYAGTFTVSRYTAMYAGSPYGGSRCFYYRALGDVTVHVWFNPCGSFGNDATAPYVYNYLTGNCTYRPGISGLVYGIAYNLVGVPCPTDPDGYCVQYPNFDPYDPPGTTGYFCLMPSQPAGAASIVYSPSFEYSQAFDALSVGGCGYDDVVFNAGIAMVTA